MATAPKEDKVFALVLERHLSLGILRSGVSGLVVLAGLGHRLCGQGSW
jgi:hypothetical protein